MNNRQPYTPTSPLRLHTGRDAHEHRQIPDLGLDARRDCLDVPHRFGDTMDYWTHFNNQVEGRNKKLIEALNANLDWLLLFAALFAGVDAGFLAFTLPTLSSGSTDDTNALLRLLIQHRDPNTISPADLEPAAFTPAAGAVRINQLISVSLTCSLLAAFGGVLGKQWLFYYNRKSQGGPFERQARNLQRRLASADRFGLKLLVEVVLPSLLQVGLFVFIIGFISYLHILNPSVALINTILASVGLAVFIGTIFHGVWDPHSPFQTPLSRFLWFLISTPLDLIPSLIGAARRLPYELIASTNRVIGKSIVTHWSNPYKGWRDIYCYVSNAWDSSFLRTVTHRLEVRHVRKALKILRRPAVQDSVLDTQYMVWLLDKTDNPDDLRAAVQNVPAITVQPAIWVLLGNNVFVPRLHELYKSFIGQVIHDPAAPPLESDVKTFPEENAIIYGRAIVHLTVAMKSHDGDWFWESYKQSEDGWFTKWNVSDFPISVQGELACQRLLFQASLYLPVDKPVSTTECMPSALHIYIAGGIRTLLYHRLYHRLSHYPSRKFNNSWEGMKQLHQLVFHSLGSKPSPEAINLTAWGIRTLPERWLDPNRTEAAAYALFNEDHEGLWKAYKHMTEASILENVGGALVIFSVMDQESPSSTEPSELPSHDAYIQLLHATTEYVVQHLTSKQAAMFSAPAISAIGQLIRNLLMGGVDDATLLEELGNLVHALIVKIKAPVVVGDEWLLDDVLMALARYLNAQGEYTMFVSKIREAILKSRPHPMSGDASDFLAACKLWEKPLDEVALISEKDRVELV